MRLWGSSSSEYNLGMYVQIIKGITTGGWLIWESVVAVVITQTYAGRVLGSIILWSKFKIGYTAHLRG